MLAILAADLNALLNVNYALGYLLMKGMCNIVSKRLKNRPDRLIAAWVEAFDIGQI